MNFSINLGNWNSIFAVPTSIVDKHIKLAGAVQLKVLLWVLRHSGEKITIENISKSLSIHPADIKDAMSYWTETNVLSISDNEITPGAKKIEEKVNSNKVECNSKTEELDKKILKSTKLRPLSRPQKPDSLYTADRINNDPEIKTMMQESQIILGRPISNGDCATLLMLHDNDGLPVHVIIMILQYAVEVGKPSMKYIEKIGISWANEEIDTIEKAEKKIVSLNEHHRAWVSVEKIIGIDHRSPTAKENEMAYRWIKEWKFDSNMIREAYERCVNARGKYISSYMDSIIKRWFTLNIHTIDQANEEKYSMPSKTYKNDKHKPSYNIEEYEKYSIFDDQSGMEVV